MKKFYYVIIPVAAILITVFIWRRNFWGKANANRYSSKEECETATHETCFYEFDMIPQYDPVQNADPVQKEKIFRCGKILVSGFFPASRAVEYRTSVMKEYNKCMK